MVIPPSNCAKEKWQIAYMCGLLEIKCPNQKGSISITFLDSILDSMAGHEMYSFMDSYSSYNQVKAEKEDKENKTFILEWGAYAYNVMAFGLCNVFATFQKVVTKTFKEYLNKFMQVFLDDFSVCGSKKDHLGQLQKCLEECKQNGINLNLEKCAFCVNLSVILGHIVCNDGLLMDLRKITTIITMPILVNVTKIKRFLGAVVSIGVIFKTLLAK
jgi:hypothetical protein